MSKHRTMVTLAVLALVVLAVFTIVKVIKSRTAGEDEEVAADMAVHVGTITRATLYRMITAYGTVQPESGEAGRPPAEAEVASPLPGIVLSVDCREGQRVAKGTVLFHLDNRVALVANERAQKTLAFATENFERQQKLLPVEATSRKAYLEAEQQLNEARSQLAATAADLELLTIKAPLSGTVIRINSEPGEAVELNTVLALIVDLDRLVAAVDVPSREASLLRVGQPALFESSARGTVDFIGRQIDPQTDTLPVRISLPAGSGFLPGQFLSGRIVCIEHAGCLAVPEASLIADAVGGDSGSIVLVEDGLAVPRAVTIGLREAGLVEVSAAGLKEGMVIVTEDAYAVPGKTKIHIIH